MPSNHVGAFFRIYLTRLLGIGDQLLYSVDQALSETPESPQMESWRLQHDFAQKDPRENGLLCEQAVVRFGDTEKFCLEALPGAGGCQSFVDQFFHLFVEDEVNQIPLICNVVEQGSDAQPRISRYLAQRSAFEAFLSEHYPGRSDNPLLPLLLQPLPNPDLSGATRSCRWFRPL